MLHSVLYSDSLRTLNQQELVGILGAPDRRQNDYLYYLIENRTIGLFTLYEHTLVVIRRKRYRRMDKATRIILS